MFYSFIHLKLFWNNKLYKKSYNFTIIFLFIEMLSTFLSSDIENTFCRPVFLVCSHNFAVVHLIPITPRLWLLIVFNNKINLESSVKVFIQ